MRDGSRCCFNLTMLMPTRGGVGICLGGFPSPHTSCEGGQGGPDGQAGHDVQDGEGHEVLEKALSLRSALSAPSKFSQSCF